MKPSGSVLVALGGLALALTLEVHPRCAAAMDQVPIGPRAIALGGAYTAIANDATAIFWNPAGIPRIGNQEIAGTHANLFGSGITDNYVAFVLPFSPSYAFAVDWYHTGYGDSDLNFSDNRFDLAWGIKLMNQVSVGVNGKYLTRNTELDQASVRQGSGLGLDAGILVTPFEHLRLGANLQDVFDTEMHYFGGDGSSVLYKRSLRAGVSFQPLSGGLLALDVDDRLHAGAEYSPIEWVTLRAGAEKDLSETGETPTYAMGVGLRAGIFRFDYALSLHPTLGETSHFGLFMDFNFNPAQVRIEKVEANDIYCSLQKIYAREPFGTARLRNLDSRPLSAQVTVFAPGLMDQPTEQEVIIRPKTTLDVPLTAVLSNGVMTHDGDRRVQLTVGVNYRTHRLPRSEKRSTQLVAYGPGAIQWGDGVAQAAAFVTARDPVVADFAREACRSVALTERGAFGNRNLGYAAAIVDALAALDMAYVPDPNGPYKASSQVSGTVDNVQYPRETLARRTGDCDDTTVLLASLLESVGVPTRFVDVPGHLFLLAGTGVHERNRLALGVEEDLYVADSGGVWIPLESTVLNKGFARAWKDGADAYAGWASRGRVSLVGVEQAQTRYEPAVLPDAGAGTVRALDASLQAARIADDAAIVSTWKREYLESRYGKVQAGLEETSAALNEVAQVYFSAGETQDAQAALERALAREPGSVRTRNNLANTYAVNGDHEMAFDEYRAALSSDSSDAGVWLNLGLVRYVAGDRVGADRALGEGLARSDGYEGACRLLGISIAESAAREGVRKMSTEEARELLKAALDSLPPKPGEPSTVSAARQRASKRWKTRVAAARSGSEEQMSLREILYWKE